MLQLVGGNGSCLPAWLGWGGFDECCFFEPQFHFYGVSNKKVNKNKVQNKKRGKNMTSSPEIIPKCMLLARQGDMVSGNINQGSAWGRKNRPARTFKYSKKMQANV